MLMPNVNKIQIKVTKKDHFIFTEVGMAIFYLNANFRRTRKINARKL